MKGEADTSLGFTQPVSMRSTALRTANTGEAFGVR